MLGFLHKAKIKKRVIRTTNAAIASLFIGTQLLMGGVAFAVNDNNNGVGPDKDTVTCPEGTGLSQEGNNCKITICHRSDSATNPYEVNTVDFDSATGALKDNGKGDHTTHTGPVATSESVAQNLKDNGQKWGDIIPPYTWDNNGSYAGLNWTADGQAVYNNGCNYVTVTTTEVTPAAVTFTDLCGTDNDVFTIPSTTGVDYQVGSVTQTAGDHAGSGTVTVDAVAQNGFTIANDATTEWSHDFSDEACTQELTPVTPAAVTFTDECGTENDIFTIPSTEGVDYQIGGVTQSAGNHPGSGTVTVDAVAQEGFTLAENATTEWSHDFSDTACQEEQKVTICHRTDSVTNPYEQISVSINAADGSLGNGENDHTHHTGPVATSQDVAQALKDAHEKWGDIIPPYDFDDSSFPGLNWTTEGQAVYNNDCKYTSGGVLGSSVGSISGMKFNDLNGNGKLDSGESGLSSWTIFLDTNSNGLLDNGEASTVTGSNGSYSFANLDEGDYRVCEVQQTGWTQTFGGSDQGCYDLTVNADGTLDWHNIDFGNHQLIGGQGGEVLGASTTGQVLGASTLVNTGTPVLVSILVGMTILGSVAGLTVANRRKQSI